ncbi:MAG: c-type cytochrome biogenesis protein CcmI [Rhizobiaceae bacterium]
MLFWIASALLTFAACLAILLPVVRARPGVATDGGHDIEVYRDQLAEVDRDLARGQLDAAAAEQARAEIGRRILRSAGTETGTPAHRPRRRTRTVAAAAVLMVPLVSWGVYAGIGSPDLPARPLAARLSADPSTNSVDELLSRAEAHLAANPRDGNGWDVVAPVYLRVGRAADSADAYRRSIALLGSTAQREAGLGEALTSAAGGRVTPEAEAAFERTIGLEAANEKARFFLALEAAQAGRMEEARVAFEALLATAAADSPWRSPGTRALSEVRELLAAGPGPSVADIEAAGSLTGEDRAAMIEGMVAQLDAKLRDDPDDPEGWKRLVRSYIVLGRQAEALDALSRGVTALGAGSPDAVELSAMAMGLGLVVTE